MDDDDENPHHTLLGPVSNTQFCPNPFCRRTFPADGLQNITAHFSPQTPCGQWLASIRSSTTGFPCCPNPHCHQLFDSPDESTEHLSDSACGRWLANVAAGAFLPYPSSTNDLSSELGVEEGDQGIEEDDQAEYPGSYEEVDIMSRYEGYEDSGYDPSNEAQGDYFSDEQEHEQGDVGHQDNHNNLFGNMSLNTSVGNSPSTSHYDRQTHPDGHGQPHVVSIDRPSHMQQTGLPPSTRVQFHANIPNTKEGGANLLQEIDSNDDFREARERHPYYPFASKADFDLGAWLSSGSLSQKEVDQFLKLDYVKAARPSFTSARDLRMRIESLPPVPQWRYTEISISHYKTQTPMVLYWRDGLELIEHLYGNPVFAPCIQLTPYQAFDPSTGDRMYGEFMSGNVAWRIQDGIPPGHIFLGIIGASDKTPLTMGSGNKEMHPVLLSIANIEAGVRMKASSHSYVLAAYLPIPKFLDVTKPVQSILAARVYHKCIDILTTNLKKAERRGKVMSNPWGGLDVVHTPLVSWIADYPEQLLIACTAAKQSAVSTASAAEFGDPDPHPPRTRNMTLNAIKAACTTTDPWTDIGNYYKTSQRHHLNGVVRPFWEDWGLADPSEFLTPDALHQWHKMFYDHVLKWVINIMTGPELDYRLAALQPRVGTKHWTNGVSKLKQCTGREHRELEKVLVGVAAGAVPDEVLRAIRALVEFIFQAQNIYHYDETLDALEEALREFHNYKNYILVAGGRRGKHGTLDHFQIPKLEAMQHVVRSIQLMGAAYQYTSDITERCHITLVKRPYRMSNHRDFHGQCCRFLDRDDKLRFFQLFVTLKAAGAPLLNIMEREAEDMANHYPESSWVSRVSPGEKQVELSRTRPNLFKKARSRISDDRTTAFHLTLRPHIPSISVDEAMEKFCLPDLRAALGDFISQRSYAQRGGRRESRKDCALPFTHLRVWHNVRLQQRSAQDERNFIPIQTVQALPPDQMLPYGRCHVVLVDHTSGQTTSQSADLLSIMQVRIIFQPIISNGTNAPFLFYGENFRFATEHMADIDGVAVPTPAPHIDMFLLHRHLRTNGSRMGDVAALSDIRQQVELFPKFGEIAVADLNCNNSLEAYNRFYMNNFADKETFHAILSYQ